MSNETENKTNTSLESDTLNTSVKNTDGFLKGYEKAFSDIYMGVPEMPSDIWLRILGIRRENVDKLVADLEKEGL